jgi:CRISPR-associated endoribonuclease Cas6
MPELLSLVFTLRPQLPHAEGQDSAPMWWGRAAQAALLRIVDAQAPDLALALHNGEGPRPYTVSSLLGYFPKHRLDPERTYTLRFTSLTHSLSTLLLNAAQNGLLAVGQTLELDLLPFLIETVAADAAHQPWAGQSSYQELSQNLVGTQPPARKIQFHLASPLVFHSLGRSQPIPLPELLVGSLLERWNAFSPLALPPETRRYAAEMLAISRFDLESRAVPVKDGGLRVGAVGKVQFTALNSDLYWLGILHSLAAFAQFAGAGAGTAQGFGQCRSTKEF